jgi:hypothetical protein
VKQKDNSTLRSKVSLRLRLLREIPDPVVLETHGGFGRVYLDCYQGVEGGVVFEKDPEKAAALGLQRPTWAVYEADVEYALSVGVGSHLAVNFVDVDPYGDPWPTIEAFFASDRPRPGKIAVAVNDGLRQSAKMNIAWNTSSLAGVVAKYGNSYIYKHYKEICLELMEASASQAGYNLTRWAAYYTGHANQMTHYGAILELAKKD